jgi:hypothetical protein
LFHSSQVILHDKLYIFAWTFCWHFTPRAC